MANSADNPKPVNPGDAITAKWANATRGPARVVGDGVDVSAVNGKLTIKHRPRAGRPLLPGAVLATITANSGGGEYTWARDDEFEGPAEGDAVELTGSTSVPVDSVVWVYKFGEVWGFYYAPVSAFQGIKVNTGGGSVTTPTNSLPLLLSATHYNNASSIFTYDAVTGRITVALDGCYRLSGTLHMSLPALKLTQAYGEINGTTTFGRVIAGGHVTPTGGSRDQCVMSFAVDAHLDAGDYVRMFIDIDSSGTGTLYDRSQWGLEYLGDF